jgi:hypothetical protein
MNASPMSATWQMVALSLVVSYFLASNVMLTFRHGVYNHANKLYMALLMGATMALIMALLMRNTLGALSATAASLLIIAAIRTQFLVGDRSFLKAMIEHHDAALFMSERVRRKTRDPFVQALTADIIASQTKEIKEMKEWLADK